MPIERTKPVNKGYSLVPYHLNIFCVFQIVCLLIRLYIQMTYICNVNAIIHNNNNKIGQIMDRKMAMAGVQPMIVVSFEMEELVKDMNQKIEEICQALKLGKQPRQELYTIEQVAQILKLSRVTILNYRKKGLIKFTKIGRRYLINKEDLEEFMANGFA